MTYFENRSKEEQALKRRKYLEKYPARGVQDYFQRLYAGTSRKAQLKFFNATLKGWATRCFHDIVKSPWNYTITREDLIDLYNSQDGKCALLGLNFVFRVKNVARPSVDRINRKIGYHKGNIRLVWMWINFARNVWSDKQLIACAKLLAMQNC